MKAITDKGIVDIILSEKAKRELKILEEELHIPKWFNKVR